MKLTHIHKSKYKNWKDYYWDYQFILAKEYYIPLLKKWNYIFLNKKILDIGCGNGGFTSAFGEYCNITGIDIKSFPWKKNKNVSYMPYDIFTEPKKINTDFDLIIMRDVIEHIPIQKKLNFINKALEYGKDNSKLLITFPPFYSPFGLHQQVLLKSIIKYIPFLSSISPKILIPILKILNENPKSIKAPNKAVPNAVAKTINAVVKALIDPIYLTPYISAQVEEPKTFANPFVIPRSPKKIKDDNGFSK